MHTLQVVVNYVLALGGGVVLPVVMLCLGLIFQMKLTRAFSAALTLGVAFVGMATIISFVGGALSPAAQALSKNTGVVLNVLDMGWTPLAAFSWAWPYAFLMFPVEIGINIVMLALGWTSCLNVDLWNLWGKIFTAVLVAYFSKSIIAGIWQRTHSTGFIAASIQIVIELKNADLTQKQIHKLCGIPGVSLPHARGVEMILMAPVEWVLCHIPGLKNVHINAATLREKLGLFGENHVMGFILGIVIGILAKYSLKDTLTLGISAATALVLLPMVATLFMKALAPISDAAGDFIRKRFPGREFYIGLDWPFLAGQAEIWIVGIITVPIVLLMAIILPGNGVLPFAGILIYPYSLLILTDGNILHMLLLSLITIPIHLYFGTWAAPAITDLARKVSTITLPTTQMISWSNIEAPELRFLLSQAARVLQGYWLGILGLVAYGGIYVFYFKFMKRKEAKVAEEWRLAEAADAAAATPTAGA